MNQLDFCTQIAIDCDNDINNMTFDGCNYVCTSKCNCEIVILNEFNKIQERFSTKRIYECICYDWYEHCFWASSKNCYNKLFKLDSNMNEIDCISISRVDCLGNITGVSYKYGSDTLLVASPDAIIEVDKNCGKATILFSANDKWIMGVLSLCPGMLIVTLKDEVYSIEVYDAYYNMTKCYKLDHKIIVKTLIFNPCRYTSELPSIDVFLINQYRYPYLCNHPVCFDNLGFQPCSCNFKIREDCCCDYSHCDSKDAYTAVLESIALIGTALSHILNAEGEKIQKVVAQTNDIDKILCVNREVNKTIVHVTHLEHVLYDKLSTLCECGACEDFCNEPCTCQNDCCQKANICTCGARGGSLKNLI